MPVRMGDSLSRNTIRMYIYPYLTTGWADKILGEVRILEHCNLVDPG